jgi:hypothetical protein
MGLFDHVVPSERAADLELVVRRLRKRTELTVIPMLVVEGRTDEPAFGSFFPLGDDQVFSAGTRGLVEQLVLHIDTHPIPNCDCVYLIDCDARGKTPHLADRSDLVVTEACDVEADLVSIGVAARVVRPFLGSDQRARDIVTKATEFALPMSVVRRAAHRAGVSMKRHGLQIRLHDLPQQFQAAEERVVPSEDAALRAVQAFLGWDAATADSVRALLADVPRDFRRSTLGKDALDSLFHLVRERGAGDVRGWSRDHFHQRVRRELAGEDAAQWEVGRRVRDWAQGRGHELLI